MSDETGAANFLQNIHDFWINPEVNRRKEAGTLPEEFSILRCLILLPRDKAAVVYFNNEVSWITEAKRGDGEPFNVDEEVALYEIREIVNVEPPNVDGKRVAFVFLFWNGYSYSCIFDFTPNWDESDLEESQRTWSYGPIIAKYLQDLLNERAINTNEQMQELLQKIGLWIAPALLPYPLAKMTIHINAGEMNEARRLLISFCTPTFLQGLLDTWWDVQAFQIRKVLLEEALQAHKLGLFHAAIYTLLPHAEGIITDWEYSLNIEHSKIPFRTESKTKRFRDLVLETPKIGFTRRRIIESAASFMLEGPMLSTFKQWLDSTDINFPNRHVVGHGRYDPLLFTEENSIKIFLLLDTIHKIIVESDHSSDSE